MLPDWFIAAFSLMLLGHQRGDVAVLAIDTAQSVELRAGCAPDTSRRPLLDRFQVLCRIEDRLPVLVDRFKNCGETQKLSERLVSAKTSISRADVDDSRNED